MTYTFSHHEACPKCGSDDNLSVYSDGNGGRKAYCETPGCDYSEGYSGGKPQRYHPPELDYRELRGIPKDILKRYGIGMTYDPCLLYQIYYEDGVMIGAKVRDPDKEMWWEGSNPNYKLFGMHTHNSTAYANLIITEGELDAAAAHYMTGWTAVSIPNGAKNAAKAVKRNLEWIEKFKRVYVCFDSDEPGVEATDEVMQVIKPGVAYRVSLGRKDACEYTIEDDKQAFKDCLSSAKPVAIDAYLSRDTLRDKWLAFWAGGSDNSGLKTGIRALDDWGIRLRPGELTTVYAQPAVGKSTLVRQIAANWVREGRNVLLVPFEEQGIKYFAQVVGMVNRLKILKQSPTMSERLSLFDGVADHLHLSTVTITTPKEKMRTMLEYACRSLDIDLVVFDNITKFTSVSQNQTQDIGTVMAYLVSVAQQCNTHVICVSHTSRDKDLKDGEAPGMNAGYNSGSIERFSDTVITMGRFPESNEVTVAVRKDRANNHVGEMSLLFDYETYTFRGIDYDAVRQQVRGNGSDSLPEDDPDTEPEQATEADLHNGTRVQPGLPSDEPEVRDTVRRGEGETLAGGHQEVQQPGQVSSWEPAVRLTKSFPTVQPPKFYQYL